MNKQNKIKLMYNKTSPENLQMTLETKSSTVQITENETQTTINY